MIRAPYTLASFPDPFFDSYDASRTNTVFYLPEHSDAKLVSSLLGLVSSWGAKGVPGLPQRLEAHSGATGQVPANEILLQPDGDNALSLSSLNGGFSQLDITGSVDSIANTLNALGRPKIVQTLSGQQLELTTPLPEEPQQNNSAFSKSQTKKGYYSLADLGYQDDMTVAGAFHQKTAIEIPRPAGYGIGDGSYIELHFRHSPVLDPKKSAVTIYVNDIPVRAQALTPENADKGVLKAPIPASELEKPSWKVRFGFYHDLGIIDCSKRYDEVAWSVVEKDSCVYLEPGDAYHDVSWEYFPNDFGTVQPDQIAVTLLLPEDPSSAELTGALKLAYYIGQQNKKKIRWQVQTLASFDPASAAGTVIALGKNDAVEDWKAFQDILPVTPAAGGSYHREDWVDAAEESLGSFDICEIGHTGKDHPIYAFMYASPERFNQMVDHMIAKGNMLKGQVSLVNDQGNPVVYQQEAGQRRKHSWLAWLRQLFTGSERTGSIYAGVVAVTVLLTGGVLWMVRRRNR